MINTHGLVLHINTILFIVYLILFHQLYYSGLKRERGVFPIFVALDIESKYRFDAITSCRVLVSHTLRKEEEEMLKTSFTMHLRTILPLGFCQLEHIGRGEGN